MQINKEAVQYIGVAVSGTLLGASATFLLMRKHFSAVANEEIEAVKSYYRTKKVFETPTAAAVQLLPEENSLLYDEALVALKSYLGGEDEDPTKREVEQSPTWVEEQEAAVEKHNVFEGEVRDETKPFLIDVQDYMEGISGHDQTTVVWYEYDNILADENEGIVPEIDEIIGDMNLTHFDGAEDENVIYVRNLALHTDFEVVRNTASYQVEVMGMDPEQLDQELKTARFDSIRAARTDDGPRNSG